jgi:hypothetical protein
LFFLNSEFVIELADRIARGFVVDPDEPDDARVRRLFRRVLGRDPSASEREIASTYIRGELQRATEVAAEGTLSDDAAAAVDADEAKLRAWSKLVQVLLQTNERVMID